MQHLKHQVAWQRSRREAWFLINIKNQQVNTQEDLTSWQSFTSLNDLLNKEKQE
jgi:hypothetical protein